MGTVYRQSIFPFLLNDESQEVIELRKSKTGVETLIKKHEGLIGRVIQKKCRRFLARYSFEELKQAGRVGLWKAIKRYDGNRGTAFSTVAGFWIRQAIQRFVCNDREDNAISLDREKDGDALRDMLPCSDREIERFEAKEAVIFLLENSDISERDKRIILLWAQGYTYKKIGGVFGCCHENIRQRINIALGKFRRMSIFA